MCICSATRVTFHYQDSLMDNDEQYPQLCHTYGASSFVDNIYPCTWTYLHAFLQWQGIMPILLLHCSFIYFFLKIFHIIVTALLCYYSSGHFCWLFVQGVIHGQGIIISYRYLVTNTFKDIRHISPAPAMLTENLLKWQCYLETKTLFILGIKQWPLSGGYYHVSI